MHKVLLRSVTLAYAQSLSLSQFGHVKKDIPVVHSSCAHFLHNWHSTHTSRDLLSSNGSPQIIKGHFSLSLLDDDIRGFFTADLEFPSMDSSLVWFVLVGEPSGLVEATYHNVQNRVPIREQGSYLTAWALSSSTFP